MSKHENNDSSLMGYDVKEITVNKDMGSTYIERYKNFGWELYDTSVPYHGTLTVVIQFKRDKDIRNKTELNLLEKQFESGLRQLQKTENKINYSLMIPSVGIGTIGLACFIGAIMNFVASHILSGIILLLPAVAGIALASIIHRRLKALANKKAAPHIDSQYSELNATCEEARSLATEIVRLNKDLEIALEAAEAANHNLEEKVIEKTKEVSLMHTKMLDTLATIIEYRNLESGLHIQRTMKLTEILVHAMLEKPLFRNQLIELNYDSIIKAVPLHDIGKIGIPDNILLKPGKLTDEEYEVIKKHTGIGKDMINTVAKDIKDEKLYLKHGGDIALYHHERWNGTGYIGLAGESIPLSARIVSVVDVYDALVNKRCYKESFSYDETIKIITDERGTHFDPDIVDIFLEVTDEFQKLTDELGDLKKISN